MGKQPFYTQTIRDRLWMWGHHRDMAYSAATANGNPLPGTPVDEAEGCRLMGIPNNCVIRWGNMPSHPWGDYFEQFRHLKRFSFGVSDGGNGTVWEKLEWALELKKKFPNLTGGFLDDFFSSPELHLELPDLKKVADTLRNAQMRLSVVLYSDQNGLKLEYKESTDLCDEVSFWFWNPNVCDTILDSARACRTFIGKEKDLLLGLYMWDFGNRRPMPPLVMEKQLSYALKLIKEGTVTGFIFHPSFAASFDDPAVSIAKEWIKEHGDETI